MKTITIFTPTYNRAYILPNAYKSLLQQDSSLFKWLIVDDGSTDNTEDLVKAWINENKIEINYIKQKNTGKMASHNKGVIECDTELFMCLDSDDVLCQNAIKLMVDHWHKEGGKNRLLAGIIASKRILNTRGESLNKSIIPNNLHYSTLYNLYKNGYQGETALAFRTQVLKKYPFPIFQGEKFIPEVSAYERIDEKYQYSLMKEHVMDCEYQPDGYTQNGLIYLVQNPLGAAYCSNLRSRKKKLIKPKIKEIITYGTMSLIGKQSLWSIIKNSNYPLVSFLTFPLCFIQRKIILDKLK